MAVFSSKIKILISVLTSGTGTDNNSQISLNVIVGI